MASSDRTAAVIGRFWPAAWQSSRYLAFADAFKNDQNGPRRPERVRAAMEVAAGRFQRLLRPMFSKGSIMAESRGSNGRGDPPLHSHTATLTREQFALIHVARRECHMAEDSYRQVLQEVAGVTSSKELGPEGFTAVMARFKAIGFVHRPGAGAQPARAPTPKFGARPGMATDPQIALISVLWAKWSGRADGSGLNRWIERSFRVSNIRFATTYTAGMAIQGLKKMLDRKDTARAGAATATTVEE